MRYVIAEFDQDQRAFVHDPRPYLAVLDETAERLPPGAAEFATYEGHYDRSSFRCISNLLFGALTMTDDIEAGLRLQLEPHFATHRGGLVIDYAAVRSVSVVVDPEPSPFTKRLGHLMLDEVLPHDHGCSHEIAFASGTVTIVSADLRAQWQDAPPGE